VSRVRENRMHGSTGRGWKRSSRHRASPSPNQPPHERALELIYLVVDRDGHAMLCTPESARRFEFGPGAVEQLGRELEIKDW